MNYEGTITPASIRLPAAPTRTNYVFQGWTDVPNSETAKWSANQTVTFENTENTVYAAWKNWLYHCNWCNQDTNQIHYRCSTHYNSQSCNTSRLTCTASVNKKCGYSYTCFKTFYTQQYAYQWYCAWDGRTWYSNSYNYVTVKCSYSTSHFSQMFMCCSSTCATNLYNSYRNGTCTYSVTGTCGSRYSTNYRSY